MSSAEETLAKLRLATTHLGQIYATAIEEGDDARALACAQQVMIRFAESVPDEDNGHTLLLNILFALQEIAAGRMDKHPILRGRYAVGGVGQLSALQENMNGIGAATMIFLLDHGVSENEAAKLVSRILGVGVTAPKNWINDPKRKLLKAVVRPSLARLRRDFACAAATEPFGFAEVWLRDQAKAMLTLSPR